MFFPLGLCCHAEADSLLKSPETNNMEHAIPLLSVNERDIAGSNALLPLCQIKLPLSDFYLKEIDYVDISCNAFMFQLGLSNLLKKGDSFRAFGRRFYPKRLAISTSGIK